MARSFSRVLVSEHIYQFVDRRPQNCESEGFKESDDHPLLIIRINNLGPLSQSFKVALSRPALMPSIVSSLCQETSKFVKIGCIKPRYLIKPKTPSSFLKTFVIPKSQLTLFILVLGGFKSSQHQAGTGERREVQM